MIKKGYKTPEIKIIELDQCDIITTSGMDGGIPTMSFFPTPGEGFQEVNVTGSWSKRIRY